MSGLFSQSAHPNGESLCSLPADSGSSQAECMQQHGGGGGEAESRARPLPAAPAPAPAPAAARLRRFAAEKRALPQPRVMVVLAGRDETDEPADAMSSSDSADEDFRKPASPMPSRYLGKPLCTYSGLQEFPEVVPLNVGGTYFTTRLSTLRRYDDTMLAAMFSGRHHIPRDAEGRFFIDRDGAYFGRAAPAGPREVCAQRGTVLLHRALAGEPGAGPAPDRGDGSAGLPRPAALLQGEPGAHRGDRQAAGHAAEGALRQAEDLRVQGGDARHALRAAALQLAALRAERERGQAVRAPLRGGRVLRALGGRGRRVRPAALHRERPGAARHHGRAPVHRRVRQAPHQPLLLQEAHLRVQDHLVVKPARLSSPGSRPTVGGQA
ncbi:BTB/POZ domain-containing protein KCTD7 isoform X1 [Lepisosteus oculatus]|uniref:BTB/POZ domain-containing protein KCTD7 isoform X1 n=1 Tax=Lepisosteus oculatus TaxID=7918 RepID=UPI00371ADC41